MQVWKKIPKLISPDDKNPSKEMWQMAYFDFSYTPGCLWPVIHVGSGMWGID